MSRKVRSGKLLFSVAIRFAVWSHLMDCACFAQFADAGDRQQLPDELRTSLLQIESTFRSFQISWVFEEQIFENAVKPSQTQGQLKSAESTGLVKYCNDAGRYRLTRETQSTINGSLMTFVIDFAFDGKTCFQTVARADAAEIPAGVIVQPACKLAKQAANTPVFFVDLLREMGIVVANAYSEHEHTPARSEILKLLEHEGRIDSIENDKVASESCIQVQILANSQKYTYWLDAALNHAVRKREIRSLDGTLVSRSTFQNHELMSSTNNIWIPRTCKLDRPGEDGKTQQFVLRVTSAIVDRPSRKAFDMRDFAIPGVVVGDANIVEQNLHANAFVSYVVPGGKAEIDTALMTQEIDESRFLTRHPYRVMFLMLTLFNSLVILFQIWHRISQEKTHKC